MDKKQFPTISDLADKLREAGYDQVAANLAPVPQQPKVKEDRRKARRLKRRKARKVNRMVLDETWLIFPESSDGMKYTHRLINPHFYNESGAFKSSITVTQSLSDFLN